MARIPVRMRQLVWFIAIWALSVAAIGMVALVIKAALRG